MVYLTTISMYYVLYKMGNSKSETGSMKIKKLKMIVIQSCSDVNLRAPHCLVARTPLLIKDNLPHNTCQIYVKPHLKNTLMTLEYHIFDEKALE